MGDLTVVYDACVLYPAPLRSLLMHLAMTGAFRARWSNQIHEEWMRNVEKDFPDIDRKKVERIRDLMNAHVEDCLVAGYEGLIEKLDLPDPNDRHVLAAAIHCKADVIVSFNLKDFPKVELKRHGIEAWHPDTFVVTLLEASTDSVCAALSRQRASLKNPPLDVGSFLEALGRQGLKRSVAALKEFEGRI